MLLLLKVEVKKKWEFPSFGTDWEGVFEITDVYIIHSFFPEAFLFCQEKLLTGISVSSYLCFVGSNEGERYGSMFGQIWHSKVSVVKSYKNSFVSCSELLIISGGILKKSFFACLFPFETIFMFWLFTHWAPYVKI